MAAIDMTDHVRICLTRSAKSSISNTNTSSPSKRLPWRSSSFTKRSAVVGSSTRTFHRFQGRSPLSWRLSVGYPPRYLGIDLKSKLDLKKAGGPGLASRLRQTRVEGEDTPENAHMRCVAEEAINAVLNRIKIRSIKGNVVSMDVVAAGHSDDRAILVANLALSKGARGMPKERK
jgi:hypothetical protein